MVANYQFTVPATTIKGRKNKKTGKVSKDRVVVLPGLNEIIGAARSHFAVSAGQKKKYTGICADAASVLPPITNPVAVRLIWFEKNTARDIDNITAGTKFVLDGLVEAGVLVDDSQKYVTSITHVVTVDKVNPRVVVQLEEVS